ncbi:hypothetical protein M1349_01020 [Patescibacteria group bacterium]|nr:hypothetical protein [Patescibacteria group bacterium]
MERRSGQGLLSGVKGVVFEKTRGAECPLLKKPFKIMLEENGKAADVFRSFHESHNAAVRRTFRIRQLRGRVA